MAAERLIAFGAEIWVAEGSVVSYLGFPYPTRMAIIRLADGGLFLWSPIALTPSLQATVEALGTVRYLVTPTKLHNLYLAEWKAAYPWAQLYAAPGLVQHRRDIAFDDRLMDKPPAAWANQIDQVLVQGSFAITEVAFYHRASETALIADLIQSFPPGWFKGWRGWIARRAGIVAPNAGTPLDLRATFTHRKAVRQSVKRIFDWGAEHLILAHGPLVEEDATGYMHKALSWVGLSA
ncbi:MAG TPA: DUF4336 domain-containing protein [Candidatus Binatia bacterium]|nr:DUF4336 domain-containing protein [Candidatus Binatia bacterium]